MYLSLRICDESDHWTQFLVEMGTGVLSVQLISRTFVITWAPLVYVYEHKGRVV